MSTDYEDLQTYWTTKLTTAYTQGSLEEGDYIKAKIRMKQWVAQLTKLASVSGSDLAGYTIAGRSITKRDMAGFREDTERAEAAFYAIIHGMVSLADFRADETIDPKTNT